MFRSSVSASAFYQTQAFEINGAAQLDRYLVKLFSGEKL